MNNKPNQATQSHVSFEKNLTNILFENLLLYSLSLFGVTYLIALSFYYQNNEILPSSLMFNPQFFMKSNPTEQVYSYRVFGLSPLSGVYGSRNTTFRKLDLFLS
jgi:hypothetical protein